MGYEYSLEDVAEVDATPEQLWDAIATGPGIDSWFMGRNEVTADVVRGAFGAYQPEHAIKERDPLERLVYGGDPEPDGRRIAFEFLIEARDSGSTVLRVVTSGFLPGDDWEEEFEAMTAGGALFFHTLVEYVTHFAGRVATPVTAFGPPIVNWDAAWHALGVAFGLSGRPELADRVSVAGAEGVVYAVNDQTVGIRTADAMYRFMQGFRGPMVASHHLFTPKADAATEEKSWSTWLAEVFKDS